MFGYKFCSDWVRGGQQSNRTLISSRNREFLFFVHIWPVSGSAQNAVRFVREFAGGWISPGGCGIHQSSFIEFSQRKLTRPRFQISSWRWASQWELSVGLYVVRGHIFAIRITRNSALLHWKGYISSSSKQGTCPRFFLVFTRKATVNFVICVCVCVSAWNNWNNSAPTWWIFMKFGTWLFVPNVSSNSEQSACPRILVFRRKSDC